MLTYAGGGSWGGVGGVAHAIDEQRTTAHAATYGVAHTIHDASSLFGGGAVAIAEGGDVSDLFGPPPAMQPMEQYQQQQQPNDEDYFEEIEGGRFRKDDGREMATFRCTCCPATPEIWCHK